MSEFSMTPSPALNGFARDYDGIVLHEITDRAIVSMATPNGGDVELNKAISSVYKTDWPQMGASTISPVDDAVFLGLQSDQIFVIFTPSSQSPADEVAKKLSSVAYLTDQTDSWVMIEVSGPRCRKALERICPIDLHADAFPKGKVARTAMEHMAAIIFHQAPDRFILISPRSSAKSFLHALETSALNIS